MVTDIFIRTFRKLFVNLTQHFDYILVDDISVTRMKLIKRWNRTRKFEIFYINRMEQNISARLVIHLLWAHNANVCLQQRENNNFILCFMQIKCSAFLLHEM